MELKCNKCQSNRVIPDVIICDYGGGADAKLKIRIDLNPTAYVFKGSVLTNLSAKVCGDCGFTEIYAADPKLIYEAYLKAKPSHKSADNQEFIAVESGTWVVWRQDDNGNKLQFSKNLSRDDAEKLVNLSEANGHKQVYWAEDTSIE